MNKKMKLKQVRYDMSVHESLQAKADKTHDRNLNELIRLLLLVADEHYDVQDIERLKKTYGGQ